MSSIWIIAPYNSKKIELFNEAWNYDLTNGTIAIGWTAIGDVRNMGDGELKEKIKKNSFRQRDSFIFNILYNFYHKVHTNDIVIARQGVFNIVGIGKVVKIAYYDVEKGKRRIPSAGSEWIGAHFIDVKWAKKDIRIPQQYQFPRYTMSEITTDQRYYNYIKSFLKNENLNSDYKVNYSESKENNLLINKKQIILYGPPGTGKTYNTKEMAVALLKGLPEVDLIEYEAIQEKNVKRKVNIDNIFFNRAEAAVKDLAGIEEIPRSTMTGYYSVSKKLNKKLGLVWLSHPVKSGSFAVHLRKETDSKYPANITDQISGYKSNGWGGYPEFNIKDENDTKRAIELIKFAHENL